MGSKHTHPQRNGIQIWNEIPIGFLQMHLSPVAQIRFQSVFCITCNGTQQRHQIQSAGIHAVISRAPNHSHWLIATPFPQPPMLVMSEKSDLITFKTVVSKDLIWETNLICLQSEHSLNHSQSYTLNHSYSLTLAHSHTHSPTNTHTHSHLHTLTHSPAHSRSVTHSLTHLLSKSKWCEEGQR